MEPTDRTPKSLKLPPESPDVLGVPIVALGGYASHRLDALPSSNSPRDARRHPRVLEPNCGLTGRASRAGGTRTARGVRMERT